MASEWKRVASVLEEGGVRDEDEQMSAYETLLLCISLLKDPEFSENDTNIALQSVRVHFGFSNKKHRKILEPLGKEPCENPLQEDSNTDISPCHALSYRLDLLKSLISGWSFHFEDEESYAKWCKRQLVLVVKGIAFTAVAVRKDKLSISLSELLTKLIELYTTMTPLQNTETNTVYVDGITELYSLTGLVNGSQILGYPFPLNVTLYSHLLDSLYDDTGNELYNSDSIKTVLNHVPSRLNLSDGLRTLALVCSKMRNFETNGTTTLLESTLNDIQTLNQTALLPVERAYLRQLADSLATSLTGYHNNFMTNIVNAGIVLKVLSGVEHYVQKTESAKIAVEHTLTQTLQNAICEHISKIALTTVDVKFRPNGLTCHSAQTNDYTLSGLKLTVASKFIGAIVEELEGEIRWFVPSFEIHLDKARAVITGAYCSIVYQLIIPCLKDILTDMSPELVSIFSHLRVMRAVIVEDRPVDKKALEFLAPWTYASHMLHNWVEKQQKDIPTVSKRIFDSDSFESCVSEGVWHTHSAVDLFALLDQVTALFQEVCVTVWGKEEHQNLQPSNTPALWWLNLSTLFLDVIREYISNIKGVVGGREEVAPSVPDCLIDFVHNYKGSGGGGGGSLRENLKSKAKGRMAKFSKIGKPAVDRVHSTTKNTVKTQASGWALSTTQLINRVNTLQWVYGETVKMQECICGYVGNFAPKVKELYSDVLSEIEAGVNELLVFVALKFVLVDCKGPVLHDLWRPTPQDCKLEEVLCYMDEYLSDFCGKSGISIISDSIQTIEDDLLVLMEFFGGVDEEGKAQGLDPDTMNSATCRLQKLVTLMELPSNQLVDIYNELSIGMVDYDNSDAFFSGVSKMEVVGLLMQRGDTHARDFIKRGSR